MTDDSIAAFTSDVRTFSDEMLMVMLRSLAQNRVAISEKRRIVRREIARRERAKRN